MATKLADRIEIDIAAKAREAAETERERSHQATGKAIKVLKDQHRYTWRDRGQLKWALGLLEEVAELMLSLVGLHRGPPEWELQQIAAIAWNWLEMRREPDWRREQEREGESDGD